MPTHLALLIALLFAMPAAAEVTHPSQLETLWQKLNYWLVDGAWVKMHPADVTQAVLVPPYIKRGGNRNDLSKDRLVM